MERRRVVIMGAAGRDFHNFNVLYRGHLEYEVVAFTATQIPNISGRTYPPVLAGPEYPQGIPILPEEDLPSLVRAKGVDLVVLAYSDLPEIEVMHKGSIALAAGASFLLAGPKDTMLASTKPVLSVCAVRTGAGKSPLTRFVSRFLRSRGYRIAIVRHPMPYGDLAAQAVQRFARLEDLDTAHCTIEEREEYEPHLRDGAVVFAGVDYEAILRAAERESDVVLWDGGNNDFPFYRSDLQIVVADPHRPGHELSYYPGEVNFRMADVIVVSKTDSALPENVASVEANAARVNPKAETLRGALALTADQPDRLRGRRVVVIEDGPTITHGGMAYGAGTLMARAHDATILDARPFAVGSIARVYEQYPHLKNILPAMGYSPEQVQELEETIRRSKADFVVDGSPVNLSHLIRVDVPIVNVGYLYDDLQGRMAGVLERFVRQHLTPGPAGPSQANGRDAAAA
jgi:predicted GTPase